MKASLKYEDVKDGQAAWRRKYEELERCLIRLQKLYEGEVITGNGEDSLQSPKDRVNNFFRVGYELKEMLKEDPNVDTSPSDVENFCKQNEDVGLGIDIANQTKHGTWNIFTNWRKTRKVIGAVNTHVHLLSPDGRDRTELSIEIDGQKEDCLQIIEKNFSAWHQFLQEKQLI